MIISLVIFLRICIYSEPDRSLPVPPLQNVFFVLKTVRVDLWVKLVHALVDTDKATARMKSKQGHMVVCSRSGR